MLHLFTKRRLVLVLMVLVIFSMTLFLRGDRALSESRGSNSGDNALDTTRSAQIGQSSTNLKEKQDVAVIYPTDAFRQVFETGQAQPLTLATADFDGQRRGGFDNRLLNRRRRFDCRAARQH